MACHGAPTLSTRMCRMHCCRSSSHAGARGFVLSSASSISTRAGASVHESSLRQSCLASIRAKSDVASATRAIRAKQAVAPAKAQPCRSLPSCATAPAPVHRLHEIHLPQAPNEVAGQPLPILAWLKQSAQSLNDDFARIVHTLRHGAIDSCGDAKEVLGVLQ